jgi:hypothetical protein
LKKKKDNNALFIETSIKEGTNIDSSLVDLCKQMILNLEIELMNNSLSSANYNVRNNNIKLGLNDSSRKKYAEFKKTCC